MYGTGVPFPVYCPECSRGDGWDPMSYGSEYNFQTPFFEQYRMLMGRVPRPSLMQNGVNTNCSFANAIEEVKDVYFSFSVIWGAESIYYSNNVLRSKYIFDCFNAEDSEMVYGSVGSVKNYRCRFCFWSSECIDSTLMLDCVGCSNCFGCAGLRKKQFCIWNQQYSKEEYERKISEFNIGSYHTLKKWEQEFEVFAKNIPRKYSRITKSIGCSGDEILNSKNATQAFNVSNVEEGKFMFRCPGGKQVMDVCYLGNAELVYEHTMGGSGSSQELKFIVWGAPGQHHVSYSDYCGSSSYLFGCIGLRNKQYCILNKQYTKEEYEELVPQIIKHMNDMPYVDQKGRTYKYGEFFPPELSPFAYNESSVQQYIPISKEKALQIGYRWKERERRDYKITKRAEELPDDIVETNDAITNEVVECLNKGEPDGCTQAFRIVPEELTFYRRIGVPLPRLCPNCRHMARMRMRSPMKLWKRNCSCAGSGNKNGTYQNTTVHFHEDKSCPNEFETSYAPERPEVVYCEACYNAEVV